MTTTHERALEKVARVIQIETLLADGYTREQAAHDNDKLWFHFVPAAQAAIAAYTAEMRAALPAEVVQMVERLRERGALVASVGGIACDPISGPLMTEAAALLAAMAAREARLVACRPGLQMLADDLDAQDEEAAFAQVSAVICIAAEIDGKVEP